MHTGSFFLLSSRCKSIYLRQQRSQKRQTQKSLTDESETFTQLKQLREEQGFKHDAEHLKRSFSFKLIP